MTRQWSGAEANDAPSPCQGCDGSGFLAAMGPSQASEAIILRTRAYGESDKIVTFLTDDAGKLTGIAKGAKNSRRRFANCLDPFTRVRVHFRIRVPAPAWCSWRAATCCTPPAALAEPNKFAYGSYLIELVDQLTEEAHPVPDVYQLLARRLGRARSAAPPPSAFLRAVRAAVVASRRLRSTLGDLCCVVSSRPWCGARLSRHAARQHPLRRLSPSGPAPHTGGGTDAGGAGRPQDGDPGGRPAPSLLGRRCRRSGHAPRLTCWRCTCRGRCARSS